MPHPSLVAAVLASLVLGSLAPSALAQDAEAGTHADDAATPQLTLDVREEGFVLRQYQLGCLSQLTYLVGDGKEFAVVDPQRDVGHYLRDAEALGGQITAVVLTHTNADFVAGHVELARRTGATIHVAKHSESKFPHRGVVDGDRLALGKVVLECWETPGHTLDGVCILVHVPGRATNPAYLLTGDTLFIGGIGRPDLVGGDVTPSLLAGRAFESIRRLATLPDATVVLPAHGAGSLCGAHLSPDTTSTIGREKSTNPYLQPQSRASFVARVVSGLPPAPAYFRHNVRLNREGPPDLATAPELPPGLDPDEVLARIGSGAWVVDVRDQRSYAAGHLLGAVNVALRGRLDTWTGTVVPFDAALILVGAEPEVREATFRFRRIGYDLPAGYLKGSMAAWAAAGKPVATTTLLEPKELAARLAAGTEPMIVDVRSEDEHEDLRLASGGNLPLTTPEAFGRVLDRDAETLFLCNSAYRSSLAIGLAERQGFTKLANLAGGLDAWISDRLPVVGRAAGGIPAPASSPASSPAAPGATTGTLLLPEPIEAAALAALLLDAATPVRIFDLRPAWQHAEAHVPGAVLVPLDTLVDRVRSAPAGTKFILVDRDGTVAPAAAGALLATLGQPELSLRWLKGGTARWFREIELAPTAPGPIRAEAPSPETRSPLPPPKPTPKSSRAGC